MIIRRSGKAYDKIVGKTSELVFDAKIGEHGVTGGRFLTSPSNSLPSVRSPVSAVWLAMLRRFAPFADNFKNFRYTLEANYIKEKDCPWNNT